MNLRIFLRTLLCLCGGLALNASLLAAVAPPAEKAKIEALIHHVETLKDAKFVRNGKEYDAVSAAKFLREKWEANDKEIKTAKDFVAKAASFSSTSGKPYLIRFKDGREVKCGDYLGSQLKGG
jgi:hypothetical protein